jgi:hypothetical protein
MKTLILMIGLGALMSVAAQPKALALRDYQWKQRTEVQRKGETKNVKLALVRFDSNGQMQTTPISASPEPDLPKFGLRKMIAEKKFKEFKETVRQLGELARSYGELSPEQTQRFMATASLNPEVTAQQKLIRVEGRNVLHTGDTMIVWLDAATRKQQRLEIQTIFDGKPVRISSEFRELPQGGPTFMAVSRINYDDGAVTIIIENFDHTRFETGRRAI